MMCIYNIWSEHSIWARVSNIRQCMLSDMKRTHTVRSKYLIFRTMFGFFQYIYFSSSIINFSLFVMDTTIILVQTLMHECIHDYHHITIMAWLRCSMRGDWSFNLDMLDVCYSTFTGDECMPERIMGTKFN